MEWLPWSPDMTMAATGLWNDLDRESHDYLIICEHDQMRYTLSSI